MREADLLIVVLRGGYGTRVEIGAALALGEPVILHTPDRNSLDTPWLEYPGSLTCCVGLPHLSHPAIAMAHLSPLKILRCRP